MDYGGKGSVKAEKALSSHSLQFLLPSSPLTFRGLPGVLWSFFARRMWVELDLSEVFEM